MLACLVVLSVLAQEVPLPPPPPPPLVPANPMPTNDRLAPATPLEPATPLVPAEPPPPPVEDERVNDRPPAGTRIVGSIGAGALGAALTTGGIVYVGTQQCGTPGCGSGNGFLAIATVAVGAALISLAAWGTHRLLGGKSSVGWAMLGMVAGAAVGLFGTLLIDSFVSSSSHKSTLAFPFWAYSVIGTTIAAVGAGTMPEIGNLLAVRQEQSVATPGRF